MKTVQDQAGATLLWMIGALVVLGAVAAGVALMSPSASRGKLEQEAGMRAYYNANAGLNYILSMHGSAQAENINFTNFISKMGGGGSVTMTLTGNDVFTYELGNTQANGVNGTYQIINLVGSVKDSAGKDAYSYAMYGQGKDSEVEKYTISQQEDNPLVPTANFAQVKYDFAGTKFTGDAIFSEATFNGGVTIEGSLTYLGTGSMCLELQGNSIGKSDGTSVICSNTCVTLKNINTVYGTIVSQGDITVNRGIIYGDADSGNDIYLSQWNGFIKKLSGSMGNAELIGDIDYPGNVEGDITYVTTKPDKCKSYTLPDHKKITPAPDLLDYAEKTFLGTGLSDTTTYDFNNLSTNGGAKTCFDLSAEGTYINIFIAGNLNFNSSIYIRSSESESCFDRSNKITTSNYTDKKFIDAAKRIYIDVNGSSTFGGDGHAWVGTLFSKGDIKSEGSFVSVGALYSNGSISTSGGSYAYFVRSDYANTYWK
ncbi:MAG: hypothetical protein AB7D37_04640 [Desulfovibrio sp.]